MACRLAALLPVLLVAGCTGAGQAPDWADSHSAIQVFEAGNQARASLRSIDIVVTQLTTGAHVFEFAFAAPGAVRLSASQAGVDLSAVIVGGHYYLRAPAMWQRMLGANQQTAPLVSRIDDHWVDLSAAGTQMNGVTQQVADPNFLRECLVFGPHGTLTKTGRTTVNGYSAVEVTDAGDSPGSTPGRWYVALSSPHYFLRFVATGETRSGGAPPARPTKCGSANPTGINFGVPGTTAHARVDFLQINRHFTVSPPAGAIDIRSLLP